MPWSVRTTRAANLADALRVCLHLYKSSVRASAANLQQAWGRTSCNVFPELEPFTAENPDTLKAFSKTTMEIATRACPSVAGGRRSVHVPPPHSRTTHVHAARHGLPGGSCA